MLTAALPSGPLTLTSGAAWDSGDCLLCGPDEWGRVGVRSVSFFVGPWQASCVVDRDNESKPAMDSRTMYACAALASIEPAMHGTTSIEPVMHVTSAASTWLHACAPGCSSSLSIQSLAARFSPTYVDAAAHARSRFSPTHVAAAAHARSNQFPLTRRVHASSHALIKCVTQTDGHRPRPSIYLLFVSLWLFKPPITNGSTHISICASSLAFLPKRQSKQAATRRRDAVQRADRPRAPHHAGEAVPRVRLRRVLAPRVSDLMLEGAS